MTHPLELLKSQYEIVAKLREGGMGEIYRVRHRLLEEHRIAKVLRPQLQNNAEMGARFTQEAKAAIRLRHPNIVQIFDFAMNRDGQGMIVMELIRGIDLQRIIQRRPLPEVPLVLEIARQSLRALGYLHQHGFIHRDVSPDNVMLSEDHEGRPLVKLIDLGIAKNLDSADDLTTSGTFLGKFRYASPEHFGPRGFDTIDPRSDLYSFGLVLYELLTGTYPLDSDSTSQLIAGHLYHPPKAFSETDPRGRVPEDLQSLALRLLAKRPEDRYPTAEEAIEEIDRLQTKRPIDTQILQAMMPDTGAGEPTLPMAELPPTATSPSVPEPSGSHHGTLVSPPGEERRLPTDALTVEEPPESAKPAHDDGPAPAVAALDYLVEAAREAVGHGQLQIAEEIVAGAREQTLPESSASFRLDELEARIAERREAQTEGLEEVREEVEAYLSEGRLIAADRVLFQAAEVYGDHPELVELRRRLDEGHHRGFEEDVRGFIDRAKTMADNDKIGAALELVLKAQALAVQGSEIQAELNTLGRDLEKRSAKRRRQLAETTQDRIQNALAQGDLAEARKALEEAEIQLGANEEAYDLRQVLVDTAQREIDRRCQEAQEATEAGRHATAVARLREALVLSEDDAAVRQKLSEAEALHRQNRGTLEEDPEWTQGLGNIESALEDAKLPDARRLLDEATEQWGSSPDLEALEKRLGELCGKEVDRLLQAAKSAQDTGDLLTARITLVQIFQLDPKNGEAKRLSAALDQAALNAESISPALEEAVRTVEELHSAGQHLAAWRAIQEALQNFGEAAPLTRLRRRIADAMMGDSS